MKTTTQIETRAVNTAAALLESLAQDKLTGIADAVRLSSAPRSNAAN